MKKVVVGLCLTMLFVAVIIFSTPLIRGTKEQKSDDAAGKATEGLVTAQRADTIAPKGAIEKALTEESEWREFRRTTAAKARGFGLDCYFYYREACERLMSSAEKNPALGAAIKRASGVFFIVSVEREEGISYATISIKDGTSDDRIIAFLDRAVEERRTFQKNESTAKRLGVNCSEWYPKACAGVIELVDASADLRDLFARARSAGITIYAREEFDSGIGSVTIDGRARAERIVRFLSK